MTRELNIRFLDDGTLAGTPDTSMENMRNIQEQGATESLILNVSRCEIVSPNSDIIEPVNAVLPDTRIIDPAT